jgi:hypothetical protein
MNGNATTTDVDASDSEDAGKLKRLESQKARLVRVAIRNYWKARARADDVHAKIGGPAETDQWTGLAFDMAGAAEEALLKAILAFDPTVATYRVPKRVAPNRGIVYDGKLYAAVLNTCEEGDRPMGWEDPGGVDVMHLVILDLANVVAVDKPPAPPVPA